MTKAVRFIQPHDDGKQFYIPSAVQEFEDAVADELVAAGVAVFPAKAKKAEPKKEPKAEEPKAEPKSKAKK